ncbi:MAG TPA: serine protease [Flavobacteriales bacterium]|nr:serine protease [Flavobacteriales bacterium]
MKIINLVFLVASIFASCAQAPVRQFQPVEIYSRYSPSPSKVPNKVLTAAAKITLEDEQGSIVTGTVFPIYSNEISSKHYDVYFITAAHVVRGVTPTKIEFYSIPNKNWEISNFVTLMLEDIKTVYVHPTIDVALIKAKSEVVIPLLNLTVEDPKFLEEVVAVGCPFGEPLFISQGRVIRPALTRGVWLITAPVAPGNSGGPIISTKTGKVVGITSRIYTINYGLSISYIEHMHEMVPSNSFYNIMIREIANDMPTRPIKLKRTSR